MASADPPDTPQAQRPTGENLATAAAGRIDAADRVGDLPPDRKDSPGDHPGFWICQPDHGYSQIWEITSCE